MSNKEQLNHYRKLQQYYLTDIDLSGGMYIEYQKFNKTKTTKNGKSVSNNTTSTSSN